MVAMAIIAAAPHMASFQAWRSQGRGGVWLKLPIGLSSFVPIAVEAGFVYHHAEADYVMLTAWLQDRPSSLPANASHQVGVGVLVLNALGEMLLVKEKTGPAAKLGIWKIPTGLLDATEDFSDGAVREVQEEVVRARMAFCHRYPTRPASYSSMVQAREVAV
jgi:hypothetical protein